MLIVQYLIQFSWSPIIISNSICRDELTNRTRVVRLTLHSKHNE